MQVVDYSKKFELPKQCGNHVEIFPKKIFCVIAGATGCGKTNLLLNLLLEKQKINYRDVYIYSPTIHQPAYVYLRETFESMEKMIKIKTKQSVKIAHFFDPSDEKTTLLDPIELDKNQNHVMVFDDVMLEDQTMIKKYFCSGRHNNVNVFYLVQSLHKIAKHCIRENANMFILFKQDDRALKYFYETHLSGDMDFKEFKQFCDDSWTKKHGFVVINLWDNAYCGRFWNNYTHVYIPSRYK